jgi:hypothetical protein
VTVVDDGSTDQTAAVAQRYRDRIGYLRVPHRGLSAARNAGVFATSGDYLLFLDADDYLAAAAVRRHMEMVAAHPAAAVFHSGWQYVDESGGSAIEEGPYPLAGDPFHMILSGYCPPPNSFLLRRDALETAGPFDEELRLQEDRDMWLRLAAAGHDFVTVPGALASYRRHPASMSATATTGSTLDATVAVIRRSQTYHRGCPTCATLVAGCLHDWRMATLRSLKHDVATADGSGQFVRALACLAMTTVREPSLVPTALRACGRWGFSKLHAHAAVTDVALFFHALRLARLAQRVQGRTALPVLTATAASLLALPRAVQPDAAHHATVRACIRGARWLQLRDTCLVRSIVLGSLLSDNEGVQLHVGFASQGSNRRPLEGHAWVTVGGKVVGGHPTEILKGPVTEVVIPMRRNSEVPDLLGHAD